jgi:leader peptidase (prepilin peptidase) / N-methyltransferase
MAIMAEELSVPSLRPNFAVVIGGSGATALLSFIYLPWPFAAASTILAILMIAGADVDARTFLLPDVVTYGATICGILAAPLLDPVDPWLSVGAAVLRAAGTSLLIAFLRKAYANLRGNEGLGFGDVKLAAAVGAWLPLEAIPYCFGLATTAALLSVVVRWRGEALEGLKLPFGAFLCPALWLIFFIYSLPR